MNLTEKIHITGILTLETGMHIGGSEETLEIGGIDQSVVKDKNSKLPYIPGSSLKGKLRDLLARHFGYEDIKNDVNEVFILFGEGAGGKGGRSFGKLIVRDAFMIENKKPDEVLEDKAENTIDRVTGKANPRHLERVVKGTSFAIDMVLDIYKELNVKTSSIKKRNSKGNIYYQETYSTKSINKTDLLNTIKLAFKLLEHDYLGGSGTRGYGKIKVEELSKTEITFNNDGTVKKSKKVSLKQNESDEKNG